MSLRELAAMRIVKRSKKHLPFIVPASYGDERSSPGSLKTKPQY